MLQFNWQSITLWKGNYHSTSVHVANISCDTRGVDNIIKMKNWNQWVHLHQQRKGLTNSSSSPQNCNFESRCPTFCSALTSLKKNITPFLSQQNKKVFFLSNNGSSSLFIMQGTHTKFFLIGKCKLLAGDGTRKLFPLLS